jgi:hypothetical protein
MQNGRINASGLRLTCRVVDHKSVLLVSFCQDVMQVGRVKPACLSSVELCGNPPSNQADAMASTKVHILMKG